MDWSLQPKVQGDVAAWFGSLPAVPAACKDSELLGAEGWQDQWFRPVRQDRLLENPTGRRRQVRAVQPLDPGLHRDHGRSVKQTSLPVGASMLAMQSSTITRACLNADASTWRSSRASSLLSTDSPFFRSPGRAAATALAFSEHRTMTLAVQFTNVSRQFGEVKAVDRVSIDIQDGEFFSMLGPSGSGKTTCLRLIAGFEQPSAGSIRIHGEEAAGLPPYQRDVNTVFQDYALFPHMNVLDNVAYGLKVKGVGKSRTPETRRRSPRHGRPRRLRRAQAGAALRRPAPACGPGPRPGQSSTGAAARRTAWARST